MEKFINEEVSAIFNSYPEYIREKLLFLRQLVFETAAEVDEVSEVEETLKWGEPSYLSKTGSTVRMGWKESKPTEYAVYFNCNTKLVDTFRELYRNTFHFNGNRAIVFDVADKIPVAELKHCLLLSLSYHSRKHLPLLGV